MATFHDLPKPLRENIYRLHLVHDTPLDLADFQNAVTWRPGHAKTRERFMPPICRTSKKIEKETASLFYGENAFEFPDLADLARFLSKSTRRHHKYIRHIGFKYENASYDGSNILKRVARLKGLQVLTIRLNERAMVRDMVFRHGGLAERVGDDGPTPQQYLTLHRFPAMCALLSISGLQELRLLKLDDTASDDVDGPIPGGFFETHVRSQLTSVTEERQVSSQAGGPFRFLDLPPELRNCVYEHLLTVQGPVGPAKGRHPSSAPWGSPKAGTRACSALSILQANRQIHDEADGIFYQVNQLIFYNPAQLLSFTIDIGPARASMLKDVTVHYSNFSVPGGVNIADVAFGQLRQLKGLRKLTIILPMTFSFNLRVNKHSSFITYIHANPGILPGIPRLFDLRGLNHIQLRDPPLEKAIEKLAGEQNFPFFLADTPQNRCKRGTVKLGLALKHFNEALADAQHGKVNRKLLEHTCWPSWDVYPTLKDDGTEDLDQTL